MDFNDNAQLDTGSVVNAGGGGGGGRGGGIAVGGIGGLIVLLLALFLGINPGDLMGGGQGGAPATAAASVNAQCKTGADVKKNQDCRWVAYMTSLGQYWNGVQGVQKPKKMIAFSGAISTACGQASSQVGPFYCPADQYIYIDKQFADQLLQQLGANVSMAAEAYIVGHEYGHHVQNMRGVLEKSQDGKTGPYSNQVRLELQADCYAGVWFNWTNKDDTDVISGITQQDLNDIVKAAQAVGDDHIQQQSQGRVDQDGWTHGSSKARQYWLQKGFESGNPNACDTFGTNDLGY